MMALRTEADGPTERFQVERRYPFAVDISVPAGGLGTRLDAMQAWCRDHAPDWRHREHTERGQLGERFRYYVRFHFVTEQAAEAFRRAWL